MFDKYKNLKYFIRYYKDQNRLIKSLAVVMISASSLGLFLPYFVSRRLVELMDSSYFEVLKYSFIITLIILFHQIFVYLWEKIATLFINNVTVEIRKDLLIKLNNSKYSEIKKKTSGYYLERINNDVLEISSFFTNILGITVDCLTNFGFLTAIFVLSIPCGIIFSLAIIIIIIIELIKTKINLHYTDLSKEVLELFNTKINENFKGIKDIKSLGIKAEVVFDIDILNNKIAEIQINKDKKIALLNRMKSFIQYGNETLLIVYAVGFLFPIKAISIVSFLMIINYGGFMYELVGYIAQIKDWFVQGDFKAARLLEVLNSHNIQEYGPIEKINNFSIIVNDLSYCYEFEEALLENISFKIPEKSLIAFVGQSGSGKTTLFSLISRLLICENNSIFVGDIDINDLSEKCLRDNICLINQEPFLLHDTIYRNIQIVKPKAKKEEIEKVCKKAFVYEEIIGLKDGLDTIVNESGSNLSTGQKQRIVIARALLKETSILLFDEPTANLDKTNQEAFFRMIQEIKDKRTILLITHKLNDYSIFDQVYEIKKGRLIEY